MDNKNDDEVYIYRIDHDDRIIYVSDNWQIFAEENQGDECCGVDLVMQRPLWEFISDNETRYLYKMMVEKVRANQQDVSIPIRCDSPDTRRFIEITISPLADKGIEFRGMVTRIEPRESVKLLSADYERSNDLIKICSFCKKAAVADERWVEIEAAIRHLNLFGKKKMPKLTHGVCPTCYELALAELNGDRIG